MGDAPDKQQDQQLGTLQPPAPNAALAAIAPIVQGAPDLATAVTQAFLQYTTQIAQNSPIAQRAKAAQQQKAAAAAKPAQDRPVPAAGSFGDKLSSAFDRVSGSLGDISHAHDTPGGWLSGIANVAKAREQRLEQQKKDQVLLARSQAENVALHRNFYQQDAEHRQQFHEGNQKFFDAYKETNDQETMSQEEFNNRMKDKKFAQEHLARATGEVPVTDSEGNQVMEEDSKLPVMKPVYTVMKIATKDGSPAVYEVDAGQSADMKKYLGKSYTPGAKLTVLQHNSLDQQMVAMKSATSILGNTNGKELSQEQIDSLRPLIAKTPTADDPSSIDPTVTSAISEVPGSAYAGIVRHMKNADDHLLVLQAQKQALQAKDPSNQAALDKINQDIAEYQSEKQKLATVDSTIISQKQRDEFNKDQRAANGSVAEYLSDPSKIQGHTESVIAASDDIIGTSQDPAVVAQAKRAKKMAQNVQKYEDQRKIDLAVGEQNAKEKAARIDNNPNGLSGEAFLKTLPVGRANMVRQIVEGSLPVNANAFERSTAGKPNQLADDVYAAYPDFKAYKGEAWPKALDQFTNSGLDHKKVQAYNVALEHMKSLYDHTTAEGILNPLTQAFQDRQLDITQVTREFGNAVAAGVLTQSESKEILDALLGSWWNAPTPSLKRERVVEAARLLSNKIDEVQREFNEKAPSASIKVPTLLGPEAKRSLEYVQSNGGKNAPGQPQAPAAPKGAKAGLAPGKAVDGTPVWPMEDGTIQDAQGNKYDAKTGKRQ